MDVLSFITGAGGAVICPRMGKWCGPQWLKLQATVSCGRLSEIRKFLSEHKARYSTNQKLNCQHNEMSVGIGIGIMHCRKGSDEPQKGNCPATVLVINNKVNILLPK